MWVEFFIYSEYHRIYGIYYFQALREEAARRLEELQSNLSDAKHKKRVTENVVEESQHRNEELKNQLKSNDNYRQISHLEEKLNDLMEDNKEMQETFDQMRKVCYYIELIFFMIAKFLLFSVCLLIGIRFLGLKKRCGRKTSWTVTVDSEW